MEITVEGVYLLSKRSLTCSLKCTPTRIIYVENGTILRKVCVPYAKPGSHHYGETTN